MLQMLLSSFMPVHPIMRNPEEKWSNLSMVNISFFSKLSNRMLLMMVKMHLNLI
jgi:hypothetical protein